MGPEQPPPSTAPRLAGPRFTLKSAPSVRGFVDGAWWPRSANSTSEFPALLAALSASCGPVIRFAYNLAAWTSAPRTLDVPGNRVRLEGFHTLDRRTVGLTSPSGHRLVLLLVPPEATDMVGNAILATAADHDSVASPDELLAEDRTPGSTVLPQPAEAPPEASWETDGGHLLTAAPT